MRRAVPALPVALACVPSPRPAPPPGAAAPALRSPARFKPEEVPAELQPAVARADAALRALRERLGARLAAELAAGGIVRSLGVCRRDAPALAEAVSAQTGVAVGRVAATPPPGAPLPRAWLAAVLPVTTRRAADVSALVLDLGDRVGILRPIALAASCLGCHGAAERVLPEAKLAADGAPAPFAEGDLRGFFWAEAPKEKR